MVVWGGGGRGGEGKGGEGGGGLNRFSSERAWLLKHLAEAELLRGKD